MRTVKLTDDEFDDLELLGTCTTRPTKHTPRLVKLGFATAGRSRFGEWASITEAGRAYLKSDFPRMVTSMGRNADRTANAWAKANLKPREKPPAHKPREKPPAHKPREKPAVTPNAVRVTIGKRITYYPLSAFESLKNVEKTKVFTLNKQRYKSLAVEASAGDVLVP